MLMTVEVTLRVPDINVRAPDVPVRRITNSDARFWKVIDVPGLPKVGDSVELSTRSYTFTAVVKQVRWHDDKDRFVVACQYTKRSMDAEEYQSLRADPDWTMRPLLSV
jgi:hypothetical protein